VYVPQNGTVPLFPQIILRKLYLQHLPYPEIQRTEDSYFM